VLSAIPPFREFGNVWALVALYSQAIRIRLLVPGRSPLGGDCQRQAECVCTRGAIRAPGTTCSCHRFISKEINLSVGSVGQFSVFAHWFELERAEMFRQYGSCLPALRSPGGKRAFADSREVLQGNSKEIADCLG
jgi:hypothetical protein